MTNKLKDDKIFQKDHFIHSHIESFLPPVCSFCELYLKPGNKYNDRGQYCLAFDKIPDEIYSGKVPHNTPVHNQKNQYIFEPQ